MRRPVRGGHLARDIIEPAGRERASNLKLSSPNRSHRSSVELEDALSSGRRH